MMTARQSLPLFILLASLGFGLPAIAADAAKPAATEAPAAKPSTPHDYETCIGLTDREAAKALDYARAWKSLGGGQAALHCEALALSSLGEADEAAARFQELADGMNAAPDETRAEVYAQAGTAWAVAGNLGKARAAYDEAIKRAPQEPALYLGRARVRALAKDWDGVRADAGEALAESPTLVDALTLRATALRNLGYPKAALADAERAAALAPHNLDALLERGRMRAATGNVAGARADWQDVVRFAKEMNRADDPAAAAAQGLLDKGK
ncbi:hypothetical protein [Parvibaculum sp.]|uniref:hypothetical protein n=1 Tax=Parvibaculum sp. TaxID=2024848 RepID=UPI002C6D7717|nr:hypothetical protein [Parvibaculum sp.]HUD51569.1 hypothetical protein [Parvibaculum sp.]